MPIYRFFHSLSFKQKIILGFSTLILIMILGMSYMLAEYTRMSKMTSEIIERYQPVTHITGKALKHAQISVNLLHEYLLEYDRNKIFSQRENMDQMKEDIMTLIEYASVEKLNLDKKELFYTIELTNKIEEYTQKIIELSDDYAKNHPVITYATETLNPVGIEYQGYINQILQDTEELGLTLEEVILLSDIRHSWSQLMSHMRTVITTRNQTSVENVYAYIDVNMKQTEKLKALDPDLGFYQISKIERLRKDYIIKLEYVREQLKLSTWRADTSIMIHNVMPLFDELKSIFNNTLNIEIKSAEIAANLLHNEIGKIDFVYTVIITSGILLAFVISVFITRSMSKPLQQLVIATKDVAEGKLDTHVNITSDDEISSLNDSFNEMVDKLKQSQYEILKAKENAEQANQSKTQFLRSMSHELRTPMNAVLGYSQLLAMEDLTDNQKKCVNEISRSGNHLLDLINQVLDLARIESGKIEIDLKPVQLSDIITDCLPLLSSSACESRNIEIINNTKDCNHTVIADPLNLRQILINLITNAVKYNKDNGKITIDAQKTDNTSVRISVSDTGIGLDENEIRKIFEPFQRLSFSNSSVEGSGIGLTITLQLIERMGGEMGVESKKDVGSTFWFTLPLANHEYTQHVEPIEQHPEIPLIPAKSESKSEIKIIYVEDNPANFQLMKTVTDKRDNMLLLHAGTAEQGLEMSVSSKPDIILMDISLPGMSGHEALQFLKNDQKTRDIPVIAVSAHALSEDIANALSSGFDEYITKPIDINRLNSILDQFIQAPLITH